jgi:hypothetical protein
MQGCYLCLGLTARHALNLARKVMWLVSGLSPPRPEEERVDDVGVGFGEMELGFGDQTVEPARVD